MKRVESIECIRQRCRIDDETGCWLWAGALDTQTKRPIMSMLTEDGTRRCCKLSVAFHLIRTGKRPEDSGISIQPLQTDIEPDLWMTSAVELQLAGAFDLLDTVIEMRDADPLGTTEAVTYQHVPIDTTELRDRAARMTVTKLALSYNDRVLFQLTDRLQLRKVELIGEPSQDAHQRADTGYGVAAFLWTAELTPALQALRDMLTDNTAQ
jgi:hypothetical protein